VERHIGLTVRHEWEENELVEERLYLLACFT